MKKLLNYLTIVFAVLLISSCDSENIEVPEQDLNSTSKVENETQHREGETETAYIEWEEGTDEDTKRHIREDLIIRQFLVEYMVCEDKPEGEIWIYCQDCVSKPKVKVRSIPKHSRFVPDGNCYDN